MAFIIKEHRPARRKILIALILFGWLFSGFVLYEYGWEQADTAYDQALIEQEAVQAEVEQLTKTNREMQVAMSVLQRSAQVDREAKLSMARSMKALQDKSAKLREEVSFYKGIISPQAGKSGLGIYDFRAIEAGNGLFHFKLILTLRGKNDRLTEGGVKVLFKGVLDGNEKVLGLSEVQTAEADKLYYKFRYFQELGGSFHFPKGYQPRTVIIKLLPKKWRKIGQPTKEFDWLEVRGGEA